jgi:hypothetical protein
MLHSNGRLLRFHDSGPRRHIKSQPRTRHSSWDFLCGNMFLPCILKSEKSAPYNLLCALPLTRLCYRQRQTDDPSSGRRTVDVLSWWNWVLLRSWVSNFTALVGRRCLTCLLHAPSPPPTDISQWAMQEQYDCVVLLSLFLERALGYGFYDTALRIADRFPRLCTSRSKTLPSYL